MLELDVKLKHPMIEFPDQVVALPGGGEAIVLHYVKKNAIQIVDKIDKDGEVLMTLYTCQGCDEISGLILIRLKLYVLHGNGRIILISLNTGPPSQVKVYNVDAGWIHQNSWSVKPTFPHSNLLFLTDYIRGEVFSYNLDSHLRNITVSNLKRPSSLSYISQSDDEAAYVVCDAGNHVVRTYSATWQPLTTIGTPGRENRPFSWPNSAILSPEGTLFIADYGNNRISEYTTEGQLLGHALNQSDGIHLPFGLSFSYPYLWVAYGYDETVNVKKYRMYVTN